MLLSFSLSFITSALSTYSMFFSHQFHIRTLDFQVRVKIARFHFLMQSYVEIHDLFSKLISILLASQKLHELILIQFSTGIFLSSYLWILYRCAASQVCMALYSFDLLFKRINDWSRLFSFASSVCVCALPLYIVNEYVNERHLIKKNDFFWQKSSSMADSFWYSCCALCLTWFYYKHNMKSN